MGASLAVFTADGEVRAILPEDEIEIAEQNSSATLIPYQPSSLSKLTTPIQALGSPLRTLASTLGLGQAAVGIQIEQDMQAASYVAQIDFHSSLSVLLRDAVPDAKLVDCQDILNKLAARKTPREVECIRTAAGIAACGFAKATAAIQVGRREAEVAAAVHASFEASPRAESVRRSYGFFFCMSGFNSARASAAYGRTRQRQIEEGDLVMIHANTCADGYWTDITRTYTAGRPTDRQQNMRSAIDEARKAALNAIRPGVAARDVDSAAREVMTQHALGEAFKHSTGHGVGFAAANGNALPRIHPQSPDVLEEGMTFNIEPAAYFDAYGGMRHCDMVTVTADGADVITDF